MIVKDFFSQIKKEYKGKISLYVCGPTVYDDSHIGNIRPLIIFDIFNRVGSIDNNIKFVHNITDIDDKIINRALKLKISENELSKKYENEYLKLIDQLNVKKPNFMPKVSNHINGMIEFILELIEKGYAYENDGNVYFSVNKLENYGKIANLKLDELEVNEISNNKKYDKDFSLWKLTLDDGIKFDSPWGKGRPGWHTECAYFIKHYFGTNGIDIHGGGIDLKFPHHINEMAQYFANTKKQLSDSWIYVGHLNFDSKKMSKSLNNTIKAKDFINNYSANLLRMILISKHYTKPIDISEEVIFNSKNLLLKFKNSLTKALTILAMDDININFLNSSKEFIEILKDDLRTTDAIFYLIKKLKKLNILNIKEQGERKKIVEEIISNLNLIGFKLEIKYNELKSEYIFRKKNKQYEESDKIKEEFIIC